MFFGKLSMASTKNALAHRGYGIAEKEKTPKGATHIARYEMISLAMRMEE